MTKQLTIKIKRQNKFEFIANNKVCIEEEVPVNQSDIATEIHESDIERQARRLADKLIAKY